MAGSAEATLFPFNALRNAAALRARTQLLLIVDGDMLISSSLSAELASPAGCVIVCLLTLVTSAVPQPSPVLLACPPSWPKPCRVCHPVLACCVNCLCRVRRRFPRLLNTSACLRVATVRRWRGGIQRPWRNRVSLDDSSESHAFAIINKGRLCRCRFTRMRALARARRAIVIPAFQTSQGADAVAAGGKAAVLAALAASNLSRFAPECKACHDATDYGRWAAAADDKLPYATNYATGCVEAVMHTNADMPIFISPMSLMHYHAAAVRSTKHAPALSRQHAPFPV